MEDAREALFGLAQAFFGPFGVVDVLHYAHNAHDAAVLLHGLAPPAAPDAAAIGANDLNVHAPLRVLFDALAELLAHGLTPGRRYIGFDVVAWQWRVARQAVDVITNVGPIDQPLAAHILPGAQARHAPCLGQGGVLGQQIAVCPLFLGGVMEHENQARFAVDLDRTRRHVPRYFACRAKRNHRQVVYLAIALQRFDQAHSLLRAGPDTQFGRRMANDFVTRELEHAAKRRVDLQVLAIGYAGDACRVGEGMVDGAHLLLGGLQRIGDGGVGGLRRFLYGDANVCRRTWCGWRAGGHSRHMPSLERFCLLSRSCTRPD